MENEQELAVRLGAAIRDARKARRWTQATLAEKLDVSVTYVGMMERGENLASLPLLVQLARLFGMSVAVLIGEPSREPWAEEAIGLLRGLPESTRETVLGMLRGVAVSATAKPGSPGKPPALDSRAKRRKR
jgi:transcriptional regulator with XRE-family HTH domain